MVNKDEVYEILKNSNVDLEKEKETINEVLEHPVYSKRNPKIVSDIILRKLNRKKNTSNNLQVVEREFIVLGSHDWKPSNNSNKIDKQIIYIINEDGEFDTVAKFGRFVGKDAKFPALRLIKAKCNRYVSNGVNYDTIIQILDDKIVKNLNFEEYEIFEKYEITERRKYNPILAKLGKIKSIFVKNNFENVNGKWVRTDEKIHPYQNGQFVLQMKFSEKYEDDDGSYIETLNVEIPYNKLGFVPFLNNVFDYEILELLNELEIEDAISIIRDYLYGVELYGIILPTKIGEYEYNGAKEVYERTVYSRAIVLFENTDFFG